MRIVRDEKNRNKLTIHTDVDLYKFKPKQEESIWKDRDSFWDFDRDQDSDKNPIFAKHLLQVSGVHMVAFDRYSIDITKGEVFYWRDLILQIRANLELDLNRGNRSECIGTYYCNKPKAPKMAKILKKKNLKRRKPSRRQSSEK